MRSVYVYVYIYICLEESADSLGRLHFACRRQVFTSFQEISSKKICDCYQILIARATPTQNYRTKVWRNTRLRTGLTPPPTPNIDSPLLHGRRFRCPCDEGLGTERSLMVTMMMGLIRMWVRRCRDVCSAFAGSRANSRLPR